MRWLHADAGDLEFRAGVAPFAGRAALPAERRPVGRVPFDLVPLDWAPLLDPLAWIPLGFPLVLFVPFAVQRAPEPGRAPVVARAPVGRVAEGRASAVARRGGRLPGRLLEDDCAGLRSRVWVAGRLKWGRAEAGFAGDAGIWAAGVRGKCASGDMRVSLEISETGGTGEAG